MNPHVRTMLDISTAHVSKSTKEWLEAEAISAACEHASSILIGGTQYGWFFYAQEEADQSLPPDLVAIMVHARSLGCEYVLLDADAPVCEPLQVFEW
jgi:hypothetical protein